LSEAYIHEYRRYLSYVEIVLTNALEEVRKALSFVDDTNLYAYAKSVKRLYRASRALCSILIPSLRPDECRELEDLEPLLDGDEARLREAEKRLQRIVDAVLQQLDAKGILVPKRLLEVGTPDIYGEEDADAD